jgi:uncharacterized protein YcbK (DUF882 family)
MREVGAALGIALLTLSSAAHADVTHIVQRGHTIEAIAHRYRVTEKAIIDANRLADPKHLKPGQTLVIPGVDAPKKKRTPPDKESAHRAASHVTEAELKPPPEPRGRAESDTIYAVRLGEDFHIRVKDARGHVPPTALQAFERMMRQGNAMHPVDPRLVSLVGIVSSHFGSKPIEVVSGYRAYASTQYTPHSNHNYGKALDFRIRGVSDEALRDFCRTLRSAGCGYYPNSSFVHLDVRDTKSYWVDWSRPGEPPKYDRPGVAADEGASDVPDDRNTMPAARSIETRPQSPDAAAHD